MFGVQKLKDEIEGLREEKDFFRSKFLEQVSEITALKDALTRSEKEVGRLRREVMGSSPESKRTSYKSPTRKGAAHDEQEEEKKEDHDQSSAPMAHVLSSLSVEEDDDFSSEDEDEQVAIRQKAEQLVRWASYRQEAFSQPSSPSPSSPRCSVTASEASESEAEE